MKVTSVFGSCLAAFTLLISAPGHTASSTASLASKSASDSVGSISDSFGASSGGSSKGTGVTAGDYRIIGMALVAAQPELMRLTLRYAAASGQGDVDLVVPATVAAGADLRAGGLVNARVRPYGIEFANGDTQTPFFLALDDDWHRDLNTRALSL